MPEEQTQRPADGAPESRIHDLGGLPVPARLRGEVGFADDGAEARAEAREDGGDASRERGRFGSRRPQGLAAGVTHGVAIGYYAFALDGDKKPVKTIAS